MGICKYQLHIGAHRCIVHIIHAG